MGGAFRYSRRLTPCGRGLMAPPGLTALGCQGSACDRLRLTGRLRAPPRVVMKYRCAGEVRRPWGRHFLCRLWRRKPYNRPGGRGKCNPPLVAGATTFPPRWEACHWILSRLRLPANPVPLPPQAGALWMFSNVAMSLQESIETYSAP